MYSFFFPFNCSQTTITVEIFDRTCLVCREILILRKNLWIIVFFQRIKKFFFLSRKLLIQYKKITDCKKKMGFSLDSRALRPPHSALKALAACL